MPAPKDYVDVAERIRQFKLEYPEGSLQTGDPDLIHVGDKTFVWVQARAYRAPDDHRPGIGTAWEPVPGPTPFTRDSELMNAETSAWGRAIVALGFETKHIASSNEVRNRQSGDDETPQEAFRAPASAAADRTVSPGTLGLLKAHVESLQKGFPSPDPTHKYWDDVQSFMYETTGKAKTSELTELEGQNLVREFENRLLKAQHDQDVPIA